MHATPPAAPAFQPLTAGDPDQVGGYRLYARLGAGGMGRVYLSWTPGGRPVALKVVRPELAEDPEFRQRFAQEVASARLIHGLYTAQVVDAGPDDPVPWLATSYVPGPSLQQVVDRGGPLPEQTALLLLAGIAEALQAVHAAGVVHRDLKPANVLLAADGPRVIDFGIARAADAVALTGTGLRIGSPGFMAPEQALGAAATPATDVFALGSLIAWTSSGTAPFGRGPQSGALYRVVHEEPDLGGVPASLEHLVRLCLAKRPEQRPTTAQLIDAVHRHPALGGRLRFADGWLPAHVSTEIRDLTDLPQAPAEAGTLLVPPPTLHEAPTGTAPAPAPRPPAWRPAPNRPTTWQPAPPTTADPSAAPPATRTSRGAGRRTTRTRTVIVIAATALLLGAAGAWYLLPADDEPEDGPTPGTAAGAPPATAAGPSRSASPTATATPTPTAPPAAAPGYTAVYTGRELVSPDHGYEFDLKTGTVTPEETATWFVGRTGGEFLLPDGNDSYLARDARLGSADCLTGLDTAPAGRLAFPDVTGRAFCVRSQDGRDLAVVRVLSATPGDGPVKVSVDYYRRGGN